MDARSDRGVLSGLRVVELSAFVAVPLAGMTLAQLGAEVIRVDPLGGGLDLYRWPVTAGGTSLYWAGLNKGKRSVAVDMSAEEGRALVRRLVTAPGPDAGVVITNVAPRWLDYDDLRRDRPDLIMVVLSGGPDGAIEVDYTVNAAAGFPLVTGDGARPTNHVLPAWDVVAGSTVVTALLAAERWRTRTGEGSLVRLSLADVAFSTVGTLGYVAEVVVNDEDRAAYDNHLFGTFGRDFRTGDGETVMVVALTPRQWSGLVAAAGLEGDVAALEAELGVDLVDEGARFTARERIAGLIELWVAARTLDDVSDAFGHHGVCWGRYQSFRRLVEEDPRVRPGVNPMWSEVDQPGVGSYPVPGSPLDFSSVDRVPVAPAPVFGADTAAVLGDVLHLDGGTVDALRDRGVL